MSSRFVVVVRDRQAAVEISDDGKRAVAQAGNEKREAPSPAIGSKLWEAMLASGLPRESANHFAVHEGDATGTLVATIHPVLTGAHATWLVLYRANREGSVFRSLGNRHRVGDALDVTFAKVGEEISMPHKP
jgi:hypothetical protein